MFCIINLHHNSTHVAPPAAGRYFPSPDSLVHLCRYLFSIFMDKPCKDTCIYLASTIINEKSRSIDQEFLQNTRTCRIPIICLCNRIFKTFLITQIHRS